MYVFKNMYLFGNSKYVNVLCDSFSKESWLASLSDLL